MARPTPPPPKWPNGPTSNECTSTCCNCPPLPVAAWNTVSDPSNEVAAQAKALFDGLFIIFWESAAGALFLAGTAFYSVFRQSSAAEGSLMAVFNSFFVHAVNTFPELSNEIGSNVFCNVPSLLEEDIENDDDKGCLCNSGLADYNAASKVWKDIESALNIWLVSGSCLDGNKWPEFDRIKKPRRCPASFITYGDDGPCEKTGCYIEDKNGTIKALNEAIACLTTVSSKMAIGIKWHEEDMQKLNNTPSWAAEKGKRLHTNWSALPAGELFCFSLVKIGKMWIRDEFKKTIDNFLNTPATGFLEALVDAFTAKYKCKVKEFVNSVKDSCARGCGSCLGKPCEFIQGDMEPYSARDIWNMIHSAVGAHGTPFPNSFEDIIGYSRKFWTKEAVEQGVENLDNFGLQIYDLFLTTEKDVKNFVDTFAAWLENWRSKIENYENKCKCYSFTKQIGNEDSEQRPCCEPGPPPNKCYHGCNIPIIQQLQTTVPCPFPVSMGYCKWNTTVGGEDWAEVDASNPMSLVMWANDISGHAMLYGGYTATPGSAN
jgi:hypothetical protein